MPEKRKRQVANICERLAKVVKMLATKEHRNFTQQVQTLIEEAIAQRSQTTSIEEIVRKFYDLSPLELARVIESASKIQQLKIEGASTQVPKVAGNPLAAKAIKHQEVCQQVFQVLPNGGEVLQQIIDGAKPPDEALPLLVMCLSMESDEFDDLLERSFGNAESNNHS